MLSDRIFIVVGERDGIPGTAIAACLEAAGEQLAYSYTACFV